MFSGCSDDQIMVWQRDDETNQMAFLGALSCLTGVVLCLIAVCGDLLISRSSGRTVRMWHNIMANVRSIVACMGVIEGY
ncbi:hypothetical protein CDL15_Pgr014859 [Punica granatum]|uniref:Uncharacterized protein n=1 Tax=Punica granatum TaxID=22663 RepID=A0A218Y116_PUNGR|nr:hypothetical protein CDL15_Pgr014859 [Punica granatum]